MSYRKNLIGASIAFSCFLFSVSAEAQTTLIEGFEDNTNPGVWVYQPGMPAGHTLNATPTPDPIYSAAHSTEGNLSGEFRATWNLGTPQTVTSNPYEASGPTTYYSIRFNLNAPSALPNNAFGPTSTIAADFYNNTDYPVAVAFLAKGSTNQARELHRGPLVTVPSKQSFTYNWDVDNQKFGFDLGDDTYDSSVLSLAGLVVYTATAPTAENFSLFVDNIRDEAPGLSTPPAQVRLKSAVKGMTVASAVVSWEPSSETDVESYEIFHATDSNFNSSEINKLVFPATPAATVTAAVSSHELTGITPGVNHYFAVRAVDELGNRSLLSYALGINLPTALTAPQDWIVVPETVSADTGAANYAQAIVYNAQALSSNARSFQSAMASAIDAGDIVLPAGATDSIVVWSTLRDGDIRVGSALASGNIDKLEDYVAANGKLLISGSSLAASLDGDVNGKVFLNNSLNAGLKTANNLLTNVVGVGLFSDVNAFSTVSNFSGSVMAYSADRNDEIEPLGPAEGVLVLSPTARSAGVAANQKTVTLSFAFETAGAATMGTSSQTVRANLMDEILEYLVPHHSSVTDWQIF